MAGSANPQNVRPMGAGGMMPGMQNAKGGGGRPMGAGGPNQFTLGQTAGQMGGRPMGAGGPNQFTLGRPPQQNMNAMMLPPALGGTQTVAPYDDTPMGRGPNDMRGNPNFTPDFSGMQGVRTPGMGGPNQFTIGQTAGQMGGAPAATAPATAPAAAAPGTAAAPGAAPAAGGQPNVFTQASNAFNTAMQGPNIQQFMNPYTQEVMNRTATDINNARQQTMNQLGQQASAAGAFGGSRHGIAEAQTNAGFAKQLADTSANLNMQGFNTALGAAQNQQQMMSNLAQQGFGFGQALNTQQMQQGALQQAMQQMLIDAAKGQYAGYTGAPQNALTLPMAALGQAGGLGMQTTTQTQNPGLFDYLSLAAGTYAGMQGAGR